MISPMWRPVALLSVGQTVVWASTFYLPAALGSVIIRDTGIPSSIFFAMITTALLASAMLGPFVGRIVDLYGGRLLLAASTLANAIGLVLLARAEDPIGVMVAWACIAVGMTIGLYEVAATTLVAITREHARRAISFYMLFGALASSISWLVTAWLLGVMGWRAACVAWAAAQIVIALPAYLMLPGSDRPPAKPPQASEPAAAEVEADTGLMRLTAIAFSAVAIVLGGFAAHLPRLIELHGYTHVEALAIAALVGPAQVLARLLDAMTVSRISPITLAALSTTLHPVGAIAMLVTLPFSQFLFPLLHGITSGITMTARATIPLTVFGREGFGERFGRLSRVVRICSALAPVIFAVLIERLGVLTLAVSTGLCVVSAIIFVLLARQTARREAQFPRTAS